MFLSGLLTQKISKKGIFANKVSTTPAFTIQRNNVYTLYRRNLIKEINTWAVFQVRYSWTFFNGLEGNSDIWTRKLMRP